jgi:primase-polymerase (primpol)-like protein
MLPKFEVNITGIIGNISDITNSRQEVIGQKISLFVRRKGANNTEKTDNIQVACFDTERAKAATNIKRSATMNMVKDIAYLNITCNAVQQFNIIPKEANAVMKERWESTANQIQGDIGNIYNETRHESNIGQQEYQSNLIPAGFSNNDLDDDLPF